MCQWLYLHLQSTHNEQSLPLNAVALIFLFKDKIFPPFSFTIPTLLPDYNQHDNLQKWKILYLPHAWVDYSSSGIMLYTEWTIGSAQLDRTEQHLSLGEFMQIFYQPPHPGSDLYARWNCLGKNDDDCPQSKIWESYALPWWRIWEWQWLWTPTSSYEAYPCLFSFYHWGIL